MIEYDTAAERLAQAERDYLRLKREYEVLREAEDRGIAMLARCLLPDRAALSFTTEPGARSASAPSAAKGRPAEAASPSAEVIERLAQVRRVEVLGSAHGVEAGVDHQDLAGDTARRRAQEKDRGIGDFRGVDAAAQR